MTTRKLSLPDIADIRAYERERAAFREHVIALKRRRRVHVGTVVTFLFENRDTIRFQIQEMARVEKLVTDEAIQIELDIYNPMIPEPGQLCATMFIELTSDEQIREWLPKLVNIENSVLLVLPDGDRVRATLDEQHEAGLTRDTVTAAVHYLRWDFTPAQAAQFGPDRENRKIHIEIDHPSYLENAALSAATVDELSHDVLN